MSQVIAGPYNGKLEPIVWTLYSAGATTPGYLYTVHITGSLTTPSGVTGTGMEGFNRVLRNNESGAMHETTYAIFAVALETSAATSWSKFQIRGEVQVYVDVHTANTNQVTVGTALKSVPVRAGLTPSSGAPGRCFPPAAGTPRRLASGRHAPLPRPAPFPDRPGSRPARISPHRPPPPRPDRCG